jgi:hypothetical protein
VPQRYEQADLELVRIDEPRNDLAPRNLLARPTDAIGDHAGERCCNPGALQLLVGLREQCPGHVEVSPREVTIGLRLVHVEARHGGARGLQSGEFPVQALEVHPGARDARGLLVPHQRQLPGIEAGHAIAGLDRRARLGHPLQLATDGCRQVRSRPRADRAGRIDHGRQLPQLRRRDPHRGRTLLSLRRQHRAEQREQHQSGDPAARHRPHVAPSLSGRVASVRLASDARCSPSRNRLGIRNQVKVVPTIMPPATTAARPR